MEKVRFGVVGAGGIARRRTIREVQKYAQYGEIVALMDVDAKVLEETAREFGIERTFTDLPSLLKEDIEAVYVASPVYAHHEEVMAALQDGKHVLCEKPLALNRKQAEEMAEFAEKMELRLGVGYMMRYNVYHREIKRMIGEGILGQPVAGRAQLTCWYPPIPSAWRQVKALGGGGALMDMGGHCIDLLEWFLGETEAVFGLLDTIVHNYEVEDTATVVLKFKNGAQGIVDNYFNVPDRAARNLLEIYGTKGAVFAENTIGQDGRGRLFLCEDFAEGYDAAQKRQEVGYRKIDLVPEPLYAREVDAFSLWIREGRKPEIAAEIGIQNLAVIEAVYQSSQEGKLVSLV
ncbi:MAG: Gfo/Idh/MocA family oxidoreductase [Candidatus Atribacteria bacterium]|nr:Gfo/Idh/MocA family oxidoreductase [Candidatus Atribacteria bacterium]